MGSEVGTGFDDLRVLRLGEELADSIWSEVVKWKGFARGVVGSQLAPAADSIGANIAEAFGRFHYGDKLRFLFYARGSVFETRYWLNRCLARDLIDAPLVQDLSKDLESLARQLNAFANSLKAQRNGTVEEPPARYEADPSAGEDLRIFDREPRPER